MQRMCKLCLAIIVDNRRGRLKKAFIVYTVDAICKHCTACGATSVHVTKHLYGVRLRDLVYMTSIYMK